MTLYNKMTKSQPFSQQKTLGNKIKSFLLCSTFDFMKYLLNITVNISATSYLQRCFSWIFCLDIINLLNMYISQGCDGKAINLEKNKDSLIRRKEMMKKDS